MSDTMTRDGVPQNDACEAFDEHVFALVSFESRRQAVDAILAAFANYAVSLARHECPVALDQISAVVYDEVVR